MTQNELLEMVEIFITDCSDRAKRAYYEMEHNFSHKDVASAVIADIKDNEITLKFLELINNRLALAVEDEKYAVMEAYSLKETEDSLIADYYRNCM